MITEKIYRGERRDGASNVTVDGQPLSPRFDLRNHSPTGFEWGYAGSGPAQLALALVADALGAGAESTALTLYQDFKARVLTGITGDSFIITQSYILQELHTIIDERSMAAQRLDRKLHR
jgi:hypothetical protein